MSISQHYRARHVRVVSAVSASAVASALNVASNFASVSAFVSATVSVSRIRLRTKRNRLYQVSGQNRSLMGAGSVHF